MAKTFKNIPSLHRLLESAPLESVRDLLLQVDETYIYSFFTCCAIHRFNS